MSYPSFQNTGESELGEINYPTVMDEIDQWLADNFGIMPGACSSIESVKYSVAKRVAKALWPKKMEDNESMGEVEWTPYNDRYEVNRMGEIRNSKTKKPIKQYLQKSGYMAVVLKDANGWSGWEMVHRIVATTFIPNPEGNPIVDHINTIRSDNRVENLRWVDEKGNANNEQTKINRKNAIKRRRVEK